MMFVLDDIWKQVDTATHLKYQNDLNSKYNENIFCQIKWIT